MKIVLIGLIALAGHLSAQTSLESEKNSDENPTQHTTYEHTNLSPQQVEQVLEIHNQARSEVGVEALQWSDELAAYAQEWADSLAGSGCQMNHRTDSDKGENLYWTSRVSETTPTDAVHGWYSEKQGFNNEEINADNIYAIGHYTQMVWKDTREVGMGMAVCKNGGAIVVANYDPPGNYLGEKAY
ncbi:MAG: CAP domain-containing protein [Moheibacter sp.]